MTELVWVAIITTVPSLIAALAATLAARRGGVTVKQGKDAAQKSGVAAAHIEVAATQSAIAAEQTAQISNGLGENLSDQLDTIIKTQDEVVHMLHDHITDPRLHRK